MTRRLKNKAGPTSAMASTRMSRRGLPFGARSRCLCAFSIMTMAASIIAPTAMAIPPKAHDVGAKADRPHGRERQKDSDGQHEDRYQRAAQVKQEDDADQGDDQAFLDERAAQRLDRGFDEAGAIIDRNDLGAIRQGGGNRGEPLLDVLDNGERIGAEPLHDDAARDLSLAVELGDAAPLIGPDFDARDVLEAQRRPSLGFQDDILDVGRVPEIALAADHELEFGEFDRAPADIHVAGAHRVAELRERNPLRAEPKRIDHDVVLLDEPADARHFRHAFGLGRRVAHNPVLQRAQLGERSCPSPRRHIGRPIRRRWRPARGWD